MCFNFTKFDQLLDKVSPVSCCDVSNIFDKNWQKKIKQVLLLFYNSTIAFNRNLVCATRWGTLLQDYLPFCARARVWLAKVSLRACTGLQRPLWAQQQQQKTLREDQSLCRRISFFVVVVLFSSSLPYLLVCSTRSRAETFSGKSVFSGWVLRLSLWKHEKEKGERERERGDTAAAEKVSGTPWRHHVLISEEFGVDAASVSPPHVYRWVWIPFDHVMICVYHWCGSVWDALLPTFVPGVGLRVRSAGFSEVKLFLTSFADKESDVQQQEHCLDWTVKLICSMWNFYGVFFFSSWSKLLPRIKLRSHVQEQFQPLESVRSLGNSVRLCPPPSACWHLSVSSSEVPWLRLSPPLCSYHGNGNL